MKGGVKMNYLTPEEVGEKLKVDPAVVRKWLRNGDLKGEKMGNLWRIPEEAINYVGKISLRDALKILLLNQETSLAPSIQEIFEIAEAAIPSPLKKKAWEIIKKAEGLFEDGCWLGPKTGIGDFSSGMIFYRLESEDESWLDELLDLYENKELEKTAKKVVNKKVKKMLVEYLIRNKGLSERDAWKEVKEIIGLENGRDGKTNKRGS